VFKKAPLEEVEEQSADNHTEPFRKEAARGGSRR
jgi:hypothetical protein